MPPSYRLSSTFLFLSPLLLLAFMAALAVILVIAVVNCDTCQYVIRDLEQVPAKEYSFSELKARLSWGISVLLMAVLVALTYCAVLMTLQTVARPPIRYLLGLSVVAFLPIFYILASLGGFSFNELILESSVYRIGPVKGFVKAVEAMGWSSLLALAVANGQILYNVKEVAQHQTPVDDVALAAKRLSRQLRLVKLLLFLGAGALVAGTLQSGALYAWAESQLSFPGYFISVEESLGAKMAELNGAFYSLFLAAVFLPAFVIFYFLTQHLAHAAASSAAPEARQKWLTDHALDFSFVKQISSVLAMLAPYLVGGPLAQLLESLPV